MAGDGSTRRRVVDSVSEKAQEVLKEDYGNAKKVTVQAVSSGAYLYPIKGIYYFLAHKDLWKPFTSKIGPYLTLSATVLTGMFTFTFIPQMTMLFFVNGPLALVTTSLLVLSESSAIINGIARGWLLQDAILDIFDATLLTRNATAIVREGRVVTGGQNSIARLGKVLKSPFEKFSPKAFIRYMIYLPFNFIPLVGTAIFVYLQGKSRGKVVHDRYFQLKKWNNAQRSRWLSQHLGPYTAFGLVATALEMVPVASVFFTYTNTVGAALWAADIEANKSLVEKVLEMK